MVGFAWGYYIQQFGATIIILAAGFIVSCLVSAEKFPQGPLMLNLSGCKQLVFPPLAQLYMQTTFTIFNTFHDHHVQLKPFKRIYEILH